MSFRATAGWSDLKERICARVRPTIEAVTNMPPEPIVDALLSEERATIQLETLSRHPGIELRRGSSMLDVGCGFGVMVAVARRDYGLDAYGLEPAAGAGGYFDLCREVLDFYDLDSKGVIADGLGENMPFSANRYDLSYSTNVLEHVQNPEQVLDEILRVTKVNGILQVIVPNYGSVWEGHYGLPWLPHLPKRLAKSYVSLVGRDPDYLDTLNLLSRHWFDRYCRQRTDEMEVLGWGDRLFRDRLRNGFSSWGAMERLERQWRLLQKLRLIGLADFVAQRFKMQTPVVLTARKKTPHGTVARLQPSAQA